MDKKKDEGYEIVRQNTAKKTMFDLEMHMAHEIEREKGRVRKKI